MGADITLSGLKATVCNFLKAKTSIVEGSSLLGVADPEYDVVDSFVVTVSLEECKQGESNI